ncbi:MAG: glycosyltransferase family 87 protein [Pseudomonadota bacterium]
MHINRERIVGIALSLWIVAIVAWWGAITFVINMLDQSTHQIDFAVYWAAGRLALEGDAMAVWDAARFNAAQGFDPNADAILGWFYPATFHLLVTPLGLLPFSVAYGVWIALSIGVFWRAMQHVAPVAFPLVIISPAIFLAAKLGSNAPLFAACLAFALTHLSQPRRSGAAIAVLTLKPGLGPIVAIALISGRRWEVVFWITLFAASFAAISTSIFGWAHWIAFLNGLEAAVARITPEDNLTSQMISWYALARFHGLAPETAMVLHACILCGIGAMTAWMWFQPKTDPSLSAAGLAIAVALSSPHAFHYEMVYALVAVAFLLRRPTTLGDKLVALLLWIGPLPAIWPIEIVPMCSYGAPLLTLCFGYIAAKALLQKRGLGQVEV